VLKTQPLSAARAASTTNVRRKKKIYQVFRYGQRAVAAGHRYGSGSLALG
jgi:hypothetical protein